MGSNAVESVGGGRSTSRDLDCKAVGPKESPESVAIGCGVWKTVNVRRHLDAFAPVDSADVLISSTGHVYRLASNLMDEKSVDQKSQLRVWRAQRLRIVKESDACFEVAVDVVIKEFILGAGGESLRAPLQEIQLMRYVHSLYARESGQAVHPSIMHFEECFKTGQSLFMVMPQFGGQELFDFVSSGSLSETELKSIFRQLLVALSFLHRCGIAHRDLTLDNILYSRETGRVMLIDLGLSSALKRVSSLGDDFPSTHKDLEREVKDYSHFYCSQRYLPPVGKTHYLAPEILAKANLIKGNVTHDSHLMKCDVWALGICIITAVLGSYLFERASCDDETYRVVVQQAMLRELLQQWGVSVSDDLVDLVQRVLKERPSDRLSLSQIAEHSWMQ